MDVTELRCIISFYLERAHFCRCALVCRTWNAYFTPYIYQAIVLKPQNLRSICRNWVHVRKLLIKFASPLVEDISMMPGNLIELAVDGHGTSQIYSLPRAWIGFCGNNPGIFKVTVRGLHRSAVELVVKRCRSTIDLTIWDLDSFNSWAPERHSHSILWGICNQLTTLRLYTHTPAYSWEIENNEMESLPRLQHLRHLHVEHSPSSFQNQALFISLCVNIETLAWDLYEKREDVQILTQQLRHVFSTLPRLRELRFKMPRIGSVFNDDQVYWIVDLLPCLKEIKLHPASDFGHSARLVEGSLSKHFDILEKLELQGLHDIDSSVNQMLLSSCRHLRTFRSRFFSIGEDSHPPMTRLGEGQFGPLGWVCPRLSDLDIQYVNGSPEDNRRMYDQLCCLRELEHLRLATDHGGLSPILIRWNDKELPKTWKSGTLYLFEIEKVMPWMLRIWPVLNSFCTHFDTSIGRSR